MKLLNAFMGLPIVKKVGGYLKMKSTFFGDKVIRWQNLEQTK